MTPPARPARRFAFYLGARPNWLDDMPYQVPLIVSAVTLYRYQSRGESFPTSRRGRWFGDSSAFTALTGANPRKHPWHLDTDSYGACGPSTVATPAKAQAR